MGTYERLTEIHESLVNGQRKQMVEQIDVFGLYDFWAEYAGFLDAHFADDPATQLEYLTDAVVSYHRIKNR